MDMTLRLSLAMLLLACAPQASFAQSLRLPTAVYVASVAADKTSTLNCTLRPGCFESTPGYAWIDRRAGSGWQMATSTAVDAASILLWRKLIGPKHPRLAAIGFYSMAALRGSVAFQNYRRVRRAY